MILVDTSVWVLTFRARPPFRLEAVVDFAEIATCPPVVQEILQGFTEERAYRLAREAVLALPIVDTPLPLAVFEEAANLFRAARRQGFTVRSSVDCLIAASAIRHDLEVLHRDRDFGLLARVSPLRQRAV